MNLIMLVGNLGRDPEMRSTKTGTDVASFSLATTERWKNSEGEKQETTTWHNCVGFGAITTIIESYLHKGDKVFISGRLSKRRYKAKDGTEKEAVETIIDRVELLGSPKGGGKSRGRDDDDESEEEEEERPRKSRPKRGSVIPDDLDDDIPF